MPDRGRRAYGSGSVFIRRHAYYGKWRVGGVQMQRKLGPIKGPSAPDGLTRRAAEKRLRELMTTLTPPPEHSTIDILAAGGVYLDHLEHVMQRKRTTIQDYRIMLDRHIGPFFGTTPIGAITPHKVADFIATKRRDGLAANTVKNQLNFLHALFKFAVRREWAPRNPVDFVDRPPSPSSDPDIRFLDREELEALLRAAGDDLLAPTDRALWLTAAMTGLRQGELAALRWRDVDWNARVVRVRRSFSRGQYTTPKSRRSVRAVPMPDRVAAELARHSHAVDVPARRRAGLRAPAQRPTVRREQDARALQGGARTSGPTTAALPRPPPHLRHAHGRGGRAAAHAAGLDGAPRLQDDRGLRGFRSRPVARRGVGRARVRLCESGARSRH